MTILFAASNERPYEHTHADVFLLHCKTSHLHIVPRPRVCFSSEVFSPSREIKRRLNEETSSFHSQCIIESRKRTTLPVSEINWLNIRFYLLVQSDLS